MTFSILSIHASGGVSSLGASTPDLVREKARSKSNYFARSCVVSTLPFEHDGDASMPADVRIEFGEDLLRLYSQVDG